MNHNPLITIIVPVYGVEDFLRRCLDSIINQTYQNIEIIVVDDGSPDNCGAICDEYSQKDSRIIVIHQSNQGLSAARNVALDIAKGEWIMFVDSDDWVEPSFCETPLRLAQEHKVEIVSFGFIWQPSSIIRQPNTVRIVDAEEFIRHQILYDEKTINNAVWNKLFSKRLFQGIRFPLGKVYEDSITYLLIHKARKIYASDEILYNYTRNRTGSITSKKNRHKPKPLFDRFQIRYERLQFIKSHHPRLTEIQILKLTQEVLKAIPHLNIRHREERKMYKIMLDFLNENKTTILSNPCCRRLKYYIKYRWIAITYDYIRQNKQ